jgi:amidase
VKIKLMVQAIELPSKALSQQALIDMLTAPGRKSEEYRIAQAYSKEISRTRGLDHIFDKHNLDAAAFPMELGVPFLSASGYAAVRST